MLLTTATDATVDGVVPLALTKSIGGININKQMFPFVKLSSMPNVSLGKRFASLLSLIFPRQLPRSSNSNVVIKHPLHSLILMVRPRQWK
ncbi:hypothetical protein G6F47_013815 [Rhizopus delemar]|uniref:Uncharacterized protein n=1 Tax=Rhizopus oryzae TaxID=64495 RepID=A0A9P6XPS6_RHIOR|nr:hypothetical protein G6F52_013625 [Rhizopus delemar]KAG1529916.1 hypothetical protein G6F51_014001 [Rhizopus arrhizus]KAG1567982.1 hypothetical protein G6F47_013815 [Rhizopus delemar]